LVRGPELEPARVVVVSRGGDDPEPDLHERCEEREPGGRLARKRQDRHDERGGDGGGDESGRGEYLTPPETARRAEEGARERHCVRAQEARLNPGDLTPDLDGAGADLVE